jgi:hypothetical protein
MMSKYQRFVALLDAVEQSRLPFNFSSPCGCVIGIAARTFGDVTPYVACLSDQQYMDIYGGYNRVSPHTWLDKAACLAWCREQVAKWEAQDAINEAMKPDHAEQPAEVSPSPRLNDAGVDAVSEEVLSCARMSLHPDWVV